MLASHRREVTQRVDVEPRGYDEVRHDDDDGGDPFHSGQIEVGERQRTTGLGEAERGLTSQDTFVAKVGPDGSWA